MRPLFYFAFPFVIAVVRADHNRNVSYKTKESIRGPPDGWVRQDPAPSDLFLRLRIALPQPHFSILEQRLWEVSDPDHERYGAYLSKEEADALMAPHPQAIDAVSAWLSSYGIQEQDLRRSSARDWVTIRVPVTLAEEMLNTRFHIYIHSDSGESIVRTTDYSLPESLHEYIELIQPTTMFNHFQPIKGTIHWPNKRSGLSSRTITGPAGNQVNADCNDLITPMCLRQLYNAEGYKTSATNGNKIAVTSYLNQNANNEDLQRFYTEQNPAAYRSNYTFVPVNGKHVEFWDDRLACGMNNQTLEAAGWEGNFDTQYAFGLTYPTLAILYSTGGLPPFIPDTFTLTNYNEPFADWLDYVLSQENHDLPQTISTSYGDNEQTVPHNYAKRVCSGFAALGSRGISMLFSSGDTGVGGSRRAPVTQQCFTNDGTNRTTFIPMFPSTCPYVTTVGGTMDIPETAAPLSSGGFSNYFARPSYQDAAVKIFLEKLAPGTYNGLYNHTGRAYPDVAAQAYNYLMIHQDHEAVMWGTSTSVVTFASLVSMLSDARINAGKSPMGFITPWLYSRGQTALNDITVGNNPGCGTNGFNASIGWDPLTGLGTPNFRMLLALAVANHY